jgi:hypothetical protein
MQARYTYIISAEFASHILLNKLIRLSPFPSSPTRSSPATRTHFPHTALHLIISLNPYTSPSFSFVPIPRWTNGVTHAKVSQCRRGV